MHIMRNIILITILLSISITLFSQENTECDSTVYFMVQQMPLYFGDYNLFLDNVSQKVNAETKNLLRSNYTNNIIQITCKGEAIISSTNSELIQFYKILEKELNKLKWIPASHNGKNVNVQSTIPVRIINDKLDIPIFFKRVKGELVKCKITDDESGMPVSDVRLITKYNDCSYFSDENGLIEFYCEANDEIGINHINYQPFSFNLPENTSSFKIKLTNVVYGLETVDLTKNSPKKLPYKNIECNFEDWQEIKQNQSVFLGMGNFYTSEMSVFNGGYECLYNYIAQEFILPKSAFENEYIDTVNVSFTVAEDGAIKNVAFSKQLNYGIDNTLKKLFIEMPKWRPASQARKKTEQRFVIKLIIGINKYWKKNYS